MSKNKNLPETLSKLTPDRRNPRVISPEALKGLGYSMKEFGDLSGVVFNRRTNELVCGHQRIKSLTGQYGDLVIKWVSEEKGLITDPDGNVWPVRGVDWDENKQLAANITANNPAIAGVFTNDVGELLEGIQENMEEVFDACRLDELQASLSSELEATGNSVDKELFNEWVKERAESPIYNRSERRYEQPKNIESDEFFDFPDNEEATTALKEREWWVVQFSGGKDSLSALIWASVNGKKLGKKLAAYYVDTGVEFPGLSAYINDVCKMLEVELVIVKPEVDWWVWIAENGWPNLLFLPCRHKLIHSPVAKAVKERFNPKDLVFFTGMRGEESIALSTKKQWGPISSLGPKYDHYAPAYHCSKKLIEDMIAKYNIPLWEGYSMGFVRTACWCCPAQKGEQAHALQENFPGLANIMRKWEERLGPIKPLAKPPRSFDDTINAGKVRIERRKKKLAAVAGDTVPQDEPEELEEWEVAGQEAED